MYATHGHYADLHLTMPTLERLAAGVMARIARLPTDGPSSSDDYEAALAPIYAWIHALAQRLAPRPRRPPARWIGAWLAGARPALADAECAAGRSRPASRLRVAG